MAGRVRNLLNRDGRWFARLVVPKDLRPYVGKTELRTSLGADYREALKKLPSAVALLQHEIALAERRAAESGARKAVVGRYPLAPSQIALRHYEDRLAFDEEIRNADHRYAQMDVDDHYAWELREGMAGKLDNDQLDRLIGRRIELFRARGNTTVEPGTLEWREVARALCAAEYEALSRVAERHEGDWSGKPQVAVLQNVKPIPDEKPPVSLKKLFADYIASRLVIGRGRGAEKRWTPVFTNLRKFVGHDDARRLTKQNLQEWRDSLLKTHSAKTVGDVYLASVRTVLKWAVESDQLEENVAEKVRQQVPKRQLEREKGYTDAEALVILKAARDYRPVASDNIATSELPQTTAAKRWAPILCALTGARIGELMQLRKQDFRKEGDTHVMRITPAAGTVKAGGYRDVPLHQQLIDMGFLDFVDASTTDALFFRAAKGRDAAAGARATAGRVSEWLRGLGFVPDGVSPSHGWRHRFTTIGEEIGVSTRVLNAIQGHAGRTAGESYGDVTVKARKKAIDCFPPYALP